MYWLKVMAVIIVSLVAAAYGVHRHDLHMRSLWPFENATYHGSAEDHMGGIRGLPEVEAFHEMYKGRDITFGNIMSPVGFRYMVQDDGRSARLVIGYYDGEPPIHTGARMIKAVFSSRRTA